MKRLKIFYPKSDFKISKPTVVMLSLIAIFVFVQFSIKVLPEYQENLDLLSFVVIVVTFIYFIFFLIYVNFSHEKENGFYSGFLILESDKITCDNKAYFINEIEKVSILGFDYRGEFNGNINALVPKRSNGLKNYIEITSKKRVDKYYFLQTKNENIKMFKDELKVYYEKGLIEKQNFENLLK